MPRVDMASGETADIERRLQRLFTAATPEPSFVQSLRAQLLAGVPEPAGEAAPRGLAHVRARLGALVQRHAWAPAALLLPLILAAAVIAGGPGRVLADLGRLPGYLFGVGFVDLKQARALPAPIALSRDGVTLTVEQVLAQPERTVVFLRAQGLPPLADESTAPSDAGFRLRLPDGSTLAPTGWSARRGEATVEFPPLPPDVYRVELLLERLPLVLPGAAPEHWQVALGLHPVDGEAPVAGFTAPYAPDAPVESHHGVDLRLVEVAQGAESTALRLEITWPDPEWRFPRLGHERQPLLRDDIGHAYWEGALPSVASLSAGRQVAVAVEQVSVRPGAATPTPVPAAGREERTLTFAPVSPSASRLTLTIDSVTFTVPFEAEFSVDLGDDPQPGQVWPLDVWLDVLGLPVHVTGVELRADDGEAGEDEPPFALAIFTDPFPVTEDRSLAGLAFDTPLEGYRGSRGRYDPRTRVRETALLLDVLPRGPITIRAGGQGFGTEISVHGPWTLSWSLPGGPAVPMAPLSLRPEGARQEHDGLRLRLEQVTLTDRLTAVTVAMDEGPAGETLLRPLGSLPGSREYVPYYLSDERGNRYEPGVHLGWNPPGSPDFDPRRLLFQPLRPLAGRVTLHAAAVLVLRPAPAAFAVTVPPGAENGDDWAVDLAVSAGGYGLRFTEAQLREQLVILIADLPAGDGNGERLPAGLALAAVTGPDGSRRPLALEAPLVEQFSQVVAADGRRQLHVGFMAGTPGAVAPGDYRVEVAGVTEAVPGPWQLSWEVPQ